MLAALGLAACSEGDQPGASASAPPSYLYFLSAGGAGLSSDTHGRVTVTMTDTDPHAVWFTDLPAVLGDVSLFIDPEIGLDD